MVGHSFPVSTVPPVLRSLHLRLRSVAPVGRNDRSVAKGVTDRSEKGTETHPIPSASRARFARHRFTVGRSVLLSLRSFRPPAARYAVMSVVKKVINEEDYCSLIMMTYIH